MKSSFPWLIPYTEREKRDLLDNAIITFDANVLLDLYRISQSSVDDMLRSMNAKKDQIWLSNQSVYEFLKNRPSVIYENMNAFKNAKNKSSEWAENFVENLRQLIIEDNRVVDANQEFLFADLSIFNDLTESLKSGLDSKLDELRKKYTSNIDDDHILDSLDKMLLGKIGPPYSDSEKQEFYETAKRRYANKIPPGFKDQGKDGEGQYGDYILWKQIIDHAKKESKDVILISNDTKEDWIEKSKGHTVGPHHLLRKEFHEETNGQKFWAYTLESFLVHMKNAGADIEEATIEENQKLGRIYKVNNKTYKRFKKGDKEYIQIYKPEKIGLLQPKNNDFSTEKKIFEEAIQKIYSDLSNLNQLNAALKYFSDDMNYEEFNRIQNTSTEIMDNISTNINKLKLKYDIEDENS